MPATPNVFTIPSGEPFLATLARALLGGHLPVPGGKPLDPLDLPRITLLLPTRRSVKALQDAFIDLVPGRAALLPLIRPIGQPDEELSLIGTLTAGDRPAALGLEDDMPPAISPLERRLALTSMVQAWGRAQKRDLTAAQAYGLAGELGRLLDLVETEGCSLDRLAGLVPEAFSGHWRQTMAFLDILTGVWPQYLADRSLSSPAAHRDSALAAAERQGVSRASSPPTQTTFSL